MTQDSRFDEYQKEIQEIDQRCSSAVSKLKVISLNAWKKHQQRRAELVRLLGEQRKW